MANSFNWNQESAEQWDERASMWNENSQSMWDTGSRKSVVPFIEKHLDTGLRIVDAGCGDGYGSFKLWQKGYQVTGLDLSEEMVRMAKRRPEKDGLAFIRGSLDQMPFASGSFDMAVAINSLEWTEDPAKVMAEFKRVLKPSSKICVALLGPTAAPRQNSYPRLHGRKVICNTMMPWELKRFAEETGWMLLDQQGVYKSEVKKRHYDGLPDELQQALSFLWLFMFELTEK